MSNYITEDGVPLGYSSKPDDSESEGRVDLDFPAAIRIDAVSENVSEADIFNHFLSCGDIRFVIKTGDAAYIQFATSSSVTKALELEMILNGDPYTLTRISADDSTNHTQVIENVKGLQVIENMKNIKYRKSFVMVENYPELPKGTPLCQYKSKFETVGPVRHFKIAPTADGTVTLALCMDKEVDRNLLIDRFNDTVISGKRLKVYVTSDKARMTVTHVANYAICENTITIEGIRPDYEDYDVCILFRKCGSISFLEKFGSRWIICFDDPSAVFESRSFHIFSLCKQALVIGEFSKQTFLAEENSVTGSLQQNANIQQNLLQTRTKENHIYVGTSPEVQPLEPSTSQPTKRPANANGSGEPPAIIQQNGKNELRLTKDVYKYFATLTNLPKGIEENDLRELFREYEIKSISLFCSKDLYHPTSIAFMGLTSSEDVEAVKLHNNDLYRGKRVSIRHTIWSGFEFNPDKSIMLKNLPKDVSEEGITEKLENLLGLKVAHVMKPTYHYAYVEFTEGVKIYEKILNSFRKTLARFNIDVFPLYCKMPKRWMGVRSLEIKPVRKMRSLCGGGAWLNGETNDADKKYDEHNAHKLYVGNIPRDTQAEDVIDYFNNFGTVIDYTPIEKKSCYLRKSVILSFVNSKHAQNAYCQQQHFLEGSVLDVHLMDCPRLEYAKKMNSKLFTVKFHSRFLTNDEIYHALQKVVDINHTIRFDVFDDRANYVAVVKFTMKNQEMQLRKLLNMQYINDEAVKIVKGYDPTPPTENEAREKKDISNSPYRQQKEKYLSSVLYKEKLKDDMEVRSKPIKEDDIPFKSFYNDNSVQINNVSLDTSMEDIRDLFVKCGDIVDYRALLLEEDATKICYVQFKIDLAADLACTYSQRLVNGKRILVHLAKETLHVEPDRSVLVERLSPSTTAEELYEAFIQRGMIKYVQKQSPYSAIVCFKDRTCMEEAINVTTIPNSGSFIINPCYEDYDPRLFNKFSCREELIPIERMQAVLNPRILPEFHQLELERQVFENQPDDIKSRLIKEVSLARKQLPYFNVLSKKQQINAMKNEYQNFTQKEHFLRLTASEQEKLLDLSINLQRDNPDDEEKDLEVLPPAPKQARQEQLQKIEPLATNARHVAQALPTSGLVGFPRNIGPPLQMGSQQGNMFPERPGPPFPNKYPQQGPPQFSGGMPPFGAHNQQPTMVPWPGPMMGPPFGMSSPMGEMPPAGHGTPNSRWMQQRIAAMAYNVGSGPPGAMGFDGFQGPPYFN